MKSDFRSSLAWFELADEFGRQVSRAAGGADRPAGSILAGRFPLVTGLVRQPKTQTIGGYFPLFPGYILPPKRVDFPQKVGYPPKSGSAFCGGCESLAGGGLAALAPRPWKRDPRPWKPVLYPSVETRPPTVETIMKRKFDDKDAADFEGAMAFLEGQWAVETWYSIDSETGRGSIQIWLPGTGSVLHLESVDVRRVRVVERNRQRFPDRGNQ